MLYIYVNINLYSFQLSFMIIITLNLIALWPENMVSMAVTLWNKRLPLDIGRDKIL